MNKNDILSKRKYNVITEDIRKTIIEKITHDNKNIKDVIFYFQKNVFFFNFIQFYFFIYSYFIKVSDDYGIKLSTAKAIL